MMLKNSDPLCFVASCNLFYGKENISEIHLFATEGGAIQITGKYRNHSTGHWTK